MYEDRGEARKTAASATSLDSPGRPIGIHSAVPAWAARATGVAIGPQLTTFIRMPSRLYSAATDLARLAKPALAAPTDDGYDAPRLWIQFPSGAAQLNFGFDHLITPLRDMGHVSRAFGGCAENVNRTALPPFSPGVTGGPNVGSTGSFGVDLDDFELFGAADTTRFLDATTVVVERP